jgi:hypothetical protein
MDIDVGYAHLFFLDPLVNVSDNQGHNLRGKFDVAVDIVGAAVTVRWGAQQEEAPSRSQPTGKQVVGYRQ